MIGLTRTTTKRAQLHGLLLSAVIVAMLVAPQPAHARAGDLDPTYGTGGLSPHGGGGVFVLPDGKIISGNVRLNSDGSLDTSFGSSGSGSLDPVFGVRPHVSSIQGDGKLLTTVQTRDYHFLVARYTDDGRLDPTFGRKGVVHVAALYYEDEWQLQVPGEAFAALAAPDGSIVAAGFAYLPYPCGIWWVIPVFCVSVVDTIVRLGPDGTPDPRAFAIPEGAQIFDGFGHSWQSVASLRGLALDDLGRLYACIRLPGGVRSQLIRFTGAGTVDPTFAADPWAGDHCGTIYPFVDEAAAARGVLLGGPGPALRRLLENGRPDQTFGENGIVNISFGDDSEPYISSAKVVGGDVVVTGLTTRTTPWFQHIRRGFVIRLDHAGSPDTTFGIGGVALREREPAIADLASFGVQPDGKLVIGRFSGGTIRLLAS